MLLSQWQKKQAALLYYFSSAAYLEGLSERLHLLRIFSEGSSYVCEVKDRDNTFRKSKSQKRKKAKSLKINTWPFLGDLQRSISQSSIERKRNIYRTTGVYQCARGMSECSIQRMTHDEQDQFDRMFENLYNYAQYIDDTMDRTMHSSHWTDFGLTLAWERHQAAFSVLPKFRTITDVVCESGQMPPRTGVYVSLDDSDATLQFAWNGNATGKLLAGTTFNEVGRAALASMGRTKLWTNGDAMLRFVLDNLSSSNLRQDSFFEESQTAELAPSLVARNGFKSNPSLWCFVELIKDEFEEVAVEP